MVEFSISAFLVIWLFLVIFDVLRFSFLTVKAQHAVTVAMHDVALHRTGGCPGTGVALVECHVNAIFAREGINLTATFGDNIKVCSLEGTGACSYTIAEDAGLDRGRDVISISVRFPFRMSVWPVQYEIEVDAIGRVEPA